MFGLLTGFKAAYIVDIVVALFLLFFVIRGAKKGFVRACFGLVSTIVALILAFTLASTFLKQLDYLFGMSGAFTAKFEVSLAKISGFSTDISGEGMAQAALENANISQFLKDILVKNLGDLNNLPEGTTLASLAAPVAAKFLGLLISGVLVFILAKIVFFIISKILNKIIDSLAVVSLINSVLGAVLGLLKGLLFVCAILSILSIIPNENLTLFLEQTFFLKYIFDHNLLSKILSSFIH